MSDEDASTTTEDAPAEETTEEKPTETETPAPEAEDKDEPWDPERAKRKIAKLNSEAANLRKRVNEAPKPDDVAAKDTRIKELERSELQFDVAFDLGLPKTIAKRLVGDTREEMIADAQALLDELAPAKRPSTRKPLEALRGGLEPDKEPEETDTRKIAERMFRS